MEETSNLFIIIISISGVFIAFIIAASIIIKYQKTLQNKQRQMLLAVMESQIKEQQRIGQDLHDQLAPDVSNIVNMLETLKPSILDSKTNVFQNQITSLTNLRRDIRNISHNLAQTALVKHGISKAIDTFCDETENDNFSIILEEDHTLEKFPDVLQHHIINVIKELITNAKKHSNGNKVLVQIKNYGNSHAITVKDNGIGISESNNAGIGLKSIRNRVALLKGQLSIKNDNGAVFTITFPNLS